MAQILSSGGSKSKMNQTRQIHTEQKSPYDPYAAMQQNYRSTTPCKFYCNGGCKWGSSCWFSHKIKGNSIYHDIILALNQKIEELILKYHKLTIKHINDNYKHAQHSQNALKVLSVQKDNEYIKNRANDELKLVSLQKALSKAKEEIKRLNKDNKSLNDEAKQRLKDTKKELIQQKEAMDTLKDIQSLQKALSEAKEELNDKDIEIERLKKTQYINKDKLSRNERKLSSLVKALSDSKQSLDDKQREKEALAAKTISLVKSSNEAIDALIDEKQELKTLVDKFKVKLSKRDDKPPLDLSGCKDIIIEATQTKEEMEICDCKDIITQKVKQIEANEEKMKRMEEEIKDKDKEIERLNEDKSMMNIHLNDTKKESKKQIEALIDEIDRLRGPNDSMIFKPKTNDVQTKELSKSAKRKRRKKQHALGLATGDKEIYKYIMMNAWISFNYSETRNALDDLAAQEAESSLKRLYPQYNISVERFGNPLKRLSSKLCIQSTGELNVKELEDNILFVAEQRVTWKVFEEGKNRKEDEDKKENRVK